ncbi:uncharacterized protein N7483_009477 [Penicillium malachiteum]|uniref:uncharacterized protein n=1 Tax=Penicillium malachiteum TaxID=1324776 RepID=UPI0025468400|nr:uncharacterized protein N7483_009477 [Penicillium malachiteum]KAJ5721543.1 hypothetical protein N7483_009477 [Penicillium malachiteum]
MNKMILSCVLVSVCALLVAAVLHGRNVRARRSQPPPRPAHSLNECGQQEEALPDSTASGPTNEQLLATRVLQLEGQLNDYKSVCDKVCAENTDLDIVNWRLKFDLQESQASLARARQQADVRREARVAQQVNGPLPVPQTPANANHDALVANLEQTVTRLEESLAREQVQNEHVANLQQTMARLEESLASEKVQNTEYQNTLRANQELYWQHLMFFRALSKEEYDEAVGNAFPDILNCFGEAFDRLVENRAASLISRQDEAIAAPVPLINRNIPQIGTDEMDQKKKPTSTEYQQTNIEVMEGIEDSPEVPHMDGVEYPTESSVFAQVSSMEGIEGTAPVPCKAEVEVDSVSGSPKESEAVRELYNVAKEIAQLKFPESHLQGYYTAMNRLKSALDNQEAALAQLGSESRRAVKEDSRDDQLARGIRTGLQAQDPVQQTEAKLREELRLSQESVAAYEETVKQWAEGYQEVEEMYNEAKEIRLHERI